MCRLVGRCYANETELYCLPWDCNLPSFSWLYNMIVPQGTDCRQLKMSHIDMAEIGVTPERVDPTIGYILEYKEFNEPLAFF